VIDVKGLTNDVPLRHGYTLADIHELTLVAVRCELFYRARDYADRIDLAWSAIVEHLYASEQPPTRRDLVSAGMAGISRWFASEARTHGANNQSGRTTAPGTNFERYWHVFARPTPSPEERIVEQLALTQIWHALSPHVRDVITALAAHGDYHQAAQSLSRTRGQFYSQISYARKTFLTMWHEGETPAGAWGHDRRRHAAEVTGRSTAKTIRQRRARAARSSKPEREPGC
jgi:hypothetical protein